MKITINSKVLDSALKMAQKAISPKPSIPILDHFLIQGCGDTITISAFDGNVGIYCQVPAKSIDDCSAAIPARILGDIVGVLPDCEITLDIEGLQCNVSWGEGSSTIPAQSGDEYPAIPRPDRAPSIVVSADNLLSAVSHVLPFTAKDEMRPVLGGVHFKSRNGKVDVVASDSRSMAIYPMPVESSGDVNMIIPSSAMSAVKDLASGGDTINVFCDDTNVFFSNGNTFISARQVVGKFPKYESVIPTDYDNVAICKKDVFLQSIRRISVCSSKASGMLKITFKDGGNALVEAQDLNFNVAAKEKTEGCTYSGNELRIGFKSEYLMKIVSCINADMLEMKLGNEKRAALIEAPNSDDPCQFILMPMATE